MKIKVGIIGGAGYTAGELIRILLNHPKAEIVFVQSSSNKGNPVYAVHKDLLGDTDLVFTEDADFNSVDVLFLCMGHGKSKEFVAKNNIPEKVRIIDLSHDFRIKTEENAFVYGLPELNRDAICIANKIANPGCFATGIQLALLPLAKAGLLKNEVHVHAITGSTGAGQAPTETSHFSWRNGNISVYKAFEHQHLGEIIQSLKQLQPGFQHALNFIPVRGNHTRGIFVSAYTEYHGTLEKAIVLYQKYYNAHPFVFVTDENPDVKQVVNTNKAFLYLEKHGDKLMILSVTDNLLKGASGQAVQNMNLMFGIDETEGLKLKPVSF
ncbi:MAG: N-acetyl-gamma-glutamyl-phosphate reductase [Bacteroidetes bacterium GWF2_42_66]|nr:MAG: N-acetyl-gamma-glutamyl-phosphate reductase [Bacteroidetes bacterium GWA2_42_15]OFX99392.1 MAG: N-acetyl-gamma-glutamyl-phosphate reductase [Bacteroidetes bacterium GWE2_42_39]OFY40444.1 MAG: N-acetyl-gamma-glutamyl-phosphate reductase [Bacteroidetes bacterium GWF2_42_66]HBL76935.1 N-acetyl-gamma-glutamyl-phosphate reductase [Prolixibacteraceae bacterium]HCU62685.1 N-acetyl-gamma-glutamyl-phosphate reductase [Prolixibacteraceae bacterium]